MSNNIPAVSSSNRIFALPLRPLWNNRVVVLAAVGAVALIIIGLVIRYFRQAPSAPSNLIPPNNSPTSTAAGPPPAPPVKAAPKAATPPETAPQLHPVDQFFADIGINPKFQFRGESALGIIRVFPPESYKAWPDLGFRFTAQNRRGFIKDGGRGDQFATRVDHVIEAVVRLPFSGTLLSKIADPLSILSSLPRVPVEHRSAFYDFNWNGKDWEVDIQPIDPPAQKAFFASNHSLTKPFSLRIGSDTDVVMASGQSFTAQPFFIVTNETGQHRIVTVVVEGTVRDKQNTQSVERIPLPIYVPPHTELRLQQSFWEKSYVDFLRGNYVLIGTPTVVLVYYSVAGEPARRGSQ